MNAAMVQDFNPKKIQYIDEEILTAIESIKSTLLIQKSKGNKDADFLLMRMR